MKKSKTVNMNRDNGYTLIELLVAIAIGVVIMFGVTTTLTGSMQTSAVAIQTSQFDQEMRATMSVITRDLKRAGYKSDVADSIGAGTYTNDFASSAGETVRIWTAADVSVAQTAAVTTSTPLPCVTYSYDAAPTPDGALNTGTSDFRGFKLLNGVVYKRTSATAVGANCSAGSWSALTSSDIVVDALRFEWRDYTNQTDPSYTTTTPSPAGCVGTPSAGDNTKILQRVISVTLVAHSAKNTALTRTLQEEVKVRNNAYDPCGTL